MGYHPIAGFLTICRDPAVGQCQAGSLTGAVASEKGIRRSKVPSEWSGNHLKVQKAEELDCDTDRVEQVRKET